MKNGFFFLILWSILALVPKQADAHHPYVTTQELKKEIAGMIKSRDLHFLQHEVEKVTVAFLINARNQLVILDVTGESPVTCHFIRKVLSYQPVHYQQPRQLTRYTVELRLVKSALP